MAEQIKRMSPAEFRDLGYLQELNRRFLHPLGMALEVEVAVDWTHDDPRVIALAKVIGDDSHYESSLPLAIEILTHLQPPGSQRFGAVWDYRDDPEGMAYGPGMIDAKKAQRIERERSKLAVTRHDLLGFEVQPATGEIPDDE